MRRILAAAALAAAVTGVNLGFTGNAQAAEAPATQPAAQADVPVKIVVLFSSGVGYFEHIGSITGDANTELRFKTQQINDILKSLVVQDTTGKVGAIIYPSQDPIAKTLKSFQVDITNNPSLADLLNQLRGAKVTVAAGTETITATILGVEKKQKAVDKDKPPIDVWHLNLISGGTIRSIQLDDVTRLELEDPVLREELRRALEALAQSRDQDKKPVTIRFGGEGERLVRIGYVVETPVWKTSYRLVLDPKDRTKANLQGWAIVENQTDNDWGNVQLSLVSGRPISFIQEMYQPLYIPRPVVYPELFASLRPQTYEGGMQRMQEAQQGQQRADARERAENRTPARGGFGGGRAAPGAAAPAEAESRDTDRYAELAKQAMDPSASIASVASAGKAGELFQYTVGNVSLPRQKSAMLPIVTDPVEVEKLSIYNLAVLPKHPLNGARVKNTTTKHLLQGPITVFEANSYAGDAKIENLPPGQERLISYGIDLQVVANATKNRQEDAVQSGKIVKGVLHLRRKHVFTQEYAFESKADTDKTVVIEHPFRQGWKLVTPEKPAETTESLYRIKQPLPAGKAEAVTVREELVQVEELAILPMDTGALDFYAKTGEIPKPVRDALAKAVTLKNQMTDAQRLVNKHKQEIATITQEQARIRENIKTVPDRSAYHTRLIQKLEEQEKQIEALFKQSDEAQKSFEAKRKELEDYLNTLDVGGD